ncbi:MAG: tetratricopeptide repeat protein [Vicingaceae bacterium]
MKKSEFIALLELPEDLGNQHIVGLQEAVKEFPFFQSAQLLLTKAFHKTENINFEGQLKKAAAFASDRKRLHQLIFDQQVKQNSEPQEAEIATETKIPFTIRPQSQVEQNQSEEVEVNPALDSETDNKSDPAFIPNFGLVAEAHSEHKVAEQEELDDQLQKQVLTEAIHQSILLEVDNQIPDFNEESKEKLVKDSGEQESIEENIASSEFDEASAHSFSDWLNFYKEENESSTTSSLWEYTSEESKEAIAAFRPETNLPAKQEFYSASKMAKLSVQEDDDLVTETLANIYAEQGNEEKAIKAFEKLQLKYPEKKVYFAGRIKEIENQLNS